MFVNSSGVNPGLKPAAELVTSGNEELVRADCATAGGLTGHWYSSSIIHPATAAPTSALMAEHSTKRFMALTQNVS
jgi:hypothetical protein